ncbi:MAG: kinase [Novosphingobium sp.]|nr:kinase [Novosphingobium sp.]
MTGTGESTAAVLSLIGEGLAGSRARPLIVGICGAQGIGKSTLAQDVTSVCAGRGIGCAVLSLDDIYLTRAERRGLAMRVHPLLATRGPPGTHDIALGLNTLTALRRGEATALPRFDKARDDRAPANEWPLAPRPCDVLLFEGWCVGAQPQPEKALLAPVNGREAAEDPQGIWRRYCNDALAGEYRTLFAAVDRLVLLAAPGFEAVYDWRLEQERKLRESRPDGNTAGIMDAQGVARFIRLYERLTRHILDEMPARAHLVIALDKDRHVTGITRR